MHKAKPDGSVLSSNPDTSGRRSRSSSKEAYNYANLVHDPWDTPNYTQSSFSAGGLPPGCVLVHLAVHLSVSRAVVEASVAEAIERLDKIQPELVELFETAVERRDKVEHELEERVKKPSARGKSRSEPVTLDELVQAAVASLSEEERSRAVVYVSERVLEPGEEFEIDGGRVQVDAPDRLCVRRPRARRQLGPSQPLSARSTASRGRACRRRPVSAVHARDAAGA